MELTELPESMAVIGGNAVGLELGQMFARLGTRVTIVEALGRLAPFDEPEVSAAISCVLEEEGTEVVSGAAVIGVRKDGRSRSVHLSRWPHRLPRAGARHQGARHPRRLLTDHERTRILHSNPGTRDSDQS